MAFSVWACGFRYRRSDNPVARCFGITSIVLFFIVAALVLAFLAVVVYALVNALHAGHDTSEPAVQVIVPSDVAFGANIDVTCMQFICFRFDCVFGCWPAL